MKIGPHVIFGTDRAKAWATRAPLVKAVDDRGTLTAAAATGVPIRIFRHFFPTQDFSRDGADAVREVLDALGDAPATHIELFNEAAQRLDEGLRDHVRLTRQAVAFLQGARPDLTLVAFSFSTGQPQDVDWLFLKEDGFAGAKVLGIHEYWGPGLEGNETRHIHLHELLGARHPPFLISECGRDIAGNVRVGWKGQGLTAEQYERELAAFGAAIEPLDYVLGATMYTAGANFDATAQPWDSYDCDPLDVGILTQLPVLPTPTPTTNGGDIVAGLTDDLKQAMDDVKRLGLDVGKVYKVTDGWPKGTKLLFTDGGIFVTVPGVPGAYPLVDGRRVTLKK